MSRQTTSEESGLVWGRRVFTGWKVVTASALLWGLQSMLWMQGFGNLAVELRDEFGWSKTFFSVAFVATRAGSALISPAQGSAHNHFRRGRGVRCQPHSGRWP